MQFTPQQLSGGAKFSPVTRIGNWFEEIALNDAKLSEFQRKSASGQLHLRRQQAKLARCCQAVPQTFSEDGLIRFGDTIVLSHSQTHRTLACDPYEDIFPNWKKFLVSASTETNSVARNTFRVIRPPRRLQGVEDDETDPLLKYGQPFFLACNESLLVSADYSCMAPDLYLASSLKNERTITASSNHQACYMTSNGDGDSVWMVMTPSMGKVGGVERYIAVGTPVSADDDIVLVHRATNTYLTTDSNRKDLTVFGYEEEVYNCRENSCGMLSIVQAEFSGTATAGTISKADKASNFWSFKTARDRQKSVDHREFPSTPKVYDLVDELYRFFKDKGINGFVELRKSFVDIDREAQGGAGDGLIDREDIKSILKSKGAKTHQGYYDSLINTFDYNQVGLIHYKEFLHLIRGPVNEARAEMLRDTFLNFTGNRATKIPIEDIRYCINFCNHPAVQSGFCTESQFYDDYFYRVIEATKVGKVLHVTLESFVDYFSDISAAVEDDARFNRLVQSFVSSR